MRQRVVACWIETKILELSYARLRAAQGRQGSTPLGSLQKIAQSRTNQVASSLLTDLMGPSGLLDFEYNAPSGPAPLPQMQVVRTRANSIEGGTDEIQRNIIGEQILGLPGDVRVDKNIPWREVRRS
jgi:alkylation response protein AidB-like acyl-CoA dehydrogenase